MKAIGEGCGGNYSPQRSFGGRVSQLGPRQGNIVLAERSAKPGAGDHEHKRHGTLGVLPRDQPAAWQAACECRTTAVAEVGAALARIVGEASHSATFQAILAEPWELAGP